ISPLPSLQPPQPTSTLFPYTTLFRALGEDALLFAGQIPSGLLLEHLEDVDGLLGHREIGLVAVGCGDLAEVRHARRAHRQDEGGSEEHTSGLQSRENLVCSLLFEKIQ